MTETTRSMHGRFSRLASSQDLIGWRSFTEGMISREVVIVQTAHHTIQGSQLYPPEWGRRLMTKLLAVTHRQWLYQNILDQDTSTVILATKRKKAIETAIEDQLELGGTGLEEEDKFLLGINLENLETTSGETQQYWLLAILAVQEEHKLRK